MSRVRGYLQPPLTSMVFDMSSPPRPYIAFYIKTFKIHRTYHYRGTPESSCAQLEVSQVSESLSSGFDECLAGDLDMWGKS